MSSTADTSRFDRMSKGTELLAKAIACSERLRISERWKLISRKDEVPDTLNYNFTIICNKCGSTNVSIVEMYYEGCYDGWDIRCNGDCKEKRQ